MKFFYRKIKFKDQKCFYCLAKLYLCPFSPTVFANFIIAVLFSAAFVSAQEFPNKIRGYKTHKAKISVQNQNGKTEAAKEFDAAVKMGEPKITGVSVSGVTIELTIEFVSNEQSGTIDFLSFYNFKANDLAIEIEEYKTSFDFEKRQTIVLPKPLKIFVPLSQAVRGAARELIDSKTEWQIIGRVFVFGRFKKSFLKFKRVVPVEVNTKIKNPLSEIINQEAEK